jgi:hypothetical protein
MSYAWTIPAFGATPTVATVAEREAVVRANAEKTAAYQRAYQDWLARSNAYRTALAAYQARVAALNQTYAVQMADYERARAAASAAAAGQAAAYASAMASYSAAKRARDNQIATNQANAQRVLGSNPPPPNFVARGYCATSNEVATWRNYCAPVRGLGANEPYCVWQNLAVCTVPALPPLPVAPPPVRSPPVPVRPAMPPAPVDPGPPPKPPALAVVPTVAAPPPPRPMPVPPPKPVPPLVPVPVPPPQAEPLPEYVPEKRNLAVWGILAAVVVVGAGGAYWYAKKQKAKAA